MYFLKKRSFRELAIVVTLLFLVSLLVGGAYAQPYSQQVNFQTGGFEGIDVIKPDIVYGQPLEWTLLLVNDTDLYRVRYLTKEINLWESNYFIDNTYNKVLHFSTDYAGMYEDIYHTVQLPAFVENITVQNATLVNMSNSSLTFYFPELKGTHSVFLSGDSIDAMQLTDKDLIKIIQSQDFTTKRGDFRLGTPVGSITSFNVTDDLEINFSIENITQGNVIPISIDLPFFIPESAYFYFWKTVDGKMQQLPYTIDASRRVLTIYPEDGVTDDDVDGMIEASLQIHLPRESFLYEFSEQSTRVLVEEREALDISVSDGVVDEIYLVNPKSIPNRPYEAEAFAQDLLKFSVTDIMPGSTVTVELSVPEDSRDLFIKKFNPNTAEWYSFPYDRINATTIHVHLTDGELGDDDGEVEC